MAKQLCKVCKKREATCNHYLHWEDKPIKGRHHLIQKKHPKWFKWVCQRCHDKIHGIEAKRGEMRRIIALLTKNQKAKIAIGNQIRSLERLEFKIPEYLEKMIEELTQKEKEYDKEIKALLKSGDYPIWEWLSDIKGISHRLAGKLIAYIDIANTPKPSNLWQFCGYGDPKDRRRKGYKIRHNPELKAFLFQTGDSFIKQKNPYKKVYDETKKKELKKVKTKMHAHRRAMRKMIKAFLLDLYLEWRKIEKLPVSEPYSVAILHGKK